MNLYKKFLIQTYNVGIIKKSIREIISGGINQGDIVWLKHNFKDRFFADPFLVDEDKENYYILVEEFIFWEEKGKITLLTVEKQSFTLVNRKVIIEEHTHLSFPFCEFKGNTIIPESVLSGKTTAYLFDRSTLQVVGKKVILDEGLIDACFFEDSGKNKWILASNSIKPKEDLYLYRQLKHKYVKMNEGKPIMSSIELTRAAGRFFSVDGQLYRPVQDSSGRYGRQTKIVKIKQFNENGYEVEAIQTINSFKNPPFDETMHTFNVYDDCIVVDGSKDYFRFPMKAIYKCIKKGYFSAILKRFFVDGSIIL